MAWMIEVFISARAKCPDFEILPCRRQNFFAMSHFLLYNWPKKYFSFLEPTYDYSSHQDLSKYVEFLFILSILIKL